jgi:adenylate cyclase class 2
MENQEIECRFLNIDSEALKNKLLSLGAVDEGERLQESTIVYDPEFKWRDVGDKLVRIRRENGKTTLCYKEYTDDTPESHTYELEFGVEDYEKIQLFFEKIGLIPFRHQEKKRHTFKLNDAVIDIDTWPHIPTYVEIEGSSEEDMKKTAEMLGFDWKDVVFRNPM